MKNRLHTAHEHRDKFRSIISEEFCTWSSLESIELGLLISKTSEVRLQVKNWYAHDHIIKVVPRLELEPWLLYSFDSPKLSLYKVSNKRTYRLAGYRLEAVQEQGGKDSVDKEAKYRLA